MRKPKPRRERNPIDPEILPLQRIIQCDGYVVYPSWAKDKAWIRLMGCHSHVRRKFFEATGQSPRLVAWLLRQLAHLYHIETRLREAKGILDQHSGEFALYGCVEVVTLE